MPTVRTHKLPIIADLLSRHGTSLISPGLAARVRATLALAFFLATWLAHAPTYARQAPPAPSEWRDALAAVGRQPRVYHGSVGSRSLHVGLGLPGSDGRFLGTAVLLDSVNHVIATGPVRGRITAHACRLHIDLGEITARMAGACRPDTLSGTLDEVHHQSFDLIRFLYARGDDHTLGEVWLTAGP